MLTLMGNNVFPTGVDRLDKDLTIGQMQGKALIFLFIRHVAVARRSFISSLIIITGKFQMQVLPQCGHAVHEDAPEKVRLFVS